MKKLLEKIKNWWVSKPVKTRQIYEIVGFCVGLTIVFFTIIGLVNAMN